LPSCSSAWGEAEASLLGEALLVGDASLLGDGLLGVGLFCGLLVVVVGEALLVLVPP
jgi:hypothetical protein